MSLLMLGLALAAGAAPRPSAAGVLAIRAERLHLGDGRMIEDGVVLIESGRIQAVGAGVEVPEGAAVVDHRGDASPGLVALHGYSGATGGLHDPARAVLAEARVAWAFDPDHVEVEDLWKAGITTLLLTPPPQALAGGVSAAVKTSGGRVLSREVQLVLGFSAESLAENRFPTSHSGAIAELDARFTEPRGPFARAAARDLPVLLETRTRADVQRALEFARRHRLSGALHGAEWAGELAAAIREADLGVVVRPFDAGEDRRTIRSVLALAEAGVRFGFGLDAPAKNPGSLRLSTAMCLREGLAPAAAWKALCADAAAIARLERSVGRLERGLDADLVLWSGDPLSLSSRVVGVWIDGVRIEEGKR